MLSAHTDAYAHPAAKGYFKLIITVNTPEEEVPD